MEKNKPARVLRDGNLKATIWANQGENGVYFTVSPAKTFTDREGKVRDTASFSSGELLRLAELARRAYHVSGELRAEYKRNFNPMASGPIVQGGNQQSAAPATQPEANSPEQVSAHQAPAPGSS